ncbi:ribosome biogenesis protein SLX9-domain-containing protein [Dipodascopsis uninucleata]
MAPRRKSADAVVEARQAQRAYMQSLKLAATKASIERAAKFPSLSARLSGGISKPTKKSKLASKRVNLIEKIEKSSVKKGKRVDIPVGISKASRRGVILPSALSKVSTAYNKRHDLSKSARRRAQRAEKERLAGTQMTDLLNALPDTSDMLYDEDNKDISMDDADGSAHKSKVGDILMAPKSKPGTLRSNERLAKNEIDRFGKIIADDTFRDNPFATLRSFIQNRI